MSSEQAEIHLEVERKKYGVCVRERNRERERVRERNGRLWKEDRL